MVHYKSHAYVPLRYSTYPEIAIVWALKDIKLPRSSPAMLPNLNRAGAGHQPHQVVYGIYESKAFRI